MNTKTYGIGRDVNKNNSDKSDNKGDNSDNGVVITKITPSNREIVTRVLSEYKMEEHYVDAFKRLDDSRELDYTPKDIGRLIKLIVTDITETECENIKNVLFKFVAPHIKKAAIRSPYAHHRFIPSCGLSHPAAPARLRWYWILRCAVFFPAVH